MGEAILVPGLQASFGHEIPEQTRHLVSIAQPDIAYTSKENIRDQKEVLIYHHVHFILFPCLLKHGRFYFLTSKVDL